MASIVLFHHAQGLTPGVHAFAETLRSDGHTVTVPDLYEGRTFPTVDDGVAFAEKIGMDGIVDRGTAAADPLGGDLVYAGFSLGALPAQQLAQTRPGARGALLYHGGVTAGAFDTPWPASVPLQIHLMRDDPWCEMDEVTELAGEAGAELFVYDGSAHLFTDPSASDYDKPAADRVMERTLAFLSNLA